MKSYASSAQLSPSESLVQLLIGVLCKGLHVLVTVEDKTYDGYVTSMDIAPRVKADFLFAKVHVPDLDEEEGADGYFTVKVSIHTDGTVNVMPQADKPGESELEGCDVNESCRIG